MLTTCPKHQITICNLEVIVRSNGAVNYHGKLLGYFRDFKCDLSLKEVQRPRSLKIEEALTQIWMLNGHRDYQYIQSEIERILLEVINDQEITNAVNRVNQGDR